MRTEKEILDVLAVLKKRKELNQEKMCVNILQNIYQKEKDKKDNFLQDITKSIS